VHVHDQGVPSRFCHSCTCFHSVDQFERDNRICVERMAQHRAHRRLRLEKIRFDKKEKKLSMSKQAGVSGDACGGPHICQRGGYSGLHHAEAISPSAQAFPLPLLVSSTASTHKRNRGASSYSNFPDFPAVHASHRSVDVALEPALELDQHHASVHSQENAVHQRRKIAPLAPNHHNDLDGAVSRKLPQFSTVHPNWELGSDLSGLNSPHSVPIPSTSSALQSSTMVDNVLNVFNSLNSDLVDFNANNVVLSTTTVAQGTGNLFNTTQLQPSPQLQCGMVSHSLVGWMQSVEAIRDHEHQRQRHCASDHMLQLQQHRQALQRQPHPSQQRFQQHGTHVSERAVDSDIQERYHPEGYCSSDVGYGPARTQAKLGNQLYEPEMNYCGTSTASSLPPSTKKLSGTAEESNMMPQTSPVGGPQDEATIHSGTYFRRDVGHKTVERKQLEVFTVWAKLHGLSPSYFPPEGLTPEFQRWLMYKLPCAISGTIQPGCTLLTVDCLLSQSDAAKVRSDGVMALAELLISGPLGVRGDVTIGVGEEALICIADRDDSTGSIIKGSFTRKIPLNASALMPGGAGAAAECAAILRGASCSQNGGDTKPDLMRAYPSFVWTKDTSQQGTSRTVLITIPAVAFVGCSLRCRASGRTVPVAISSVHRYTTLIRTEDGGMMDAAMLQLGVHIDVTGVDGVGLLDLVRNDRLAQPQSQPQVEVSSAGGAPFLDDVDGAKLAGISTGLPAIPVLFASDFKVHTALLFLLSNSERDDDEDFASGFSDHASALYAFGALMRGKAPPQEAFQLACWSASKGIRGLAFTRRLLTTYPHVSSKEAAASLLLHATASGDVETVLLAIYHCRSAAATQGFDVTDLASTPVGGDLGETPLCRAAAVQAISGDASVFYALLSTLPNPLAWSQKRPLAKELSLTGSTLLDEAVTVATATLIRVARRCPRGATADDIILEVLASAPLLVTAKCTTRDRIRAAIFTELLANTRTASMLLSIAEKFNSLPSQESRSSGSDSNDCDNDDIHVFATAALVLWPSINAHPKATVTKISCVVPESVVQSRVVTLVSWFRMSVVGRTASCLIPDGNRSLFSVASSQFSDAGGRCDDGDEGELLREEFFRGILGTQRGTPMTDIGVMLLSMTITIAILLKTYEWNVLSAAGKYFSALPPMGVADGSILTQTIAGCAAPLVVAYSSYLVNRDVPTWLKRRESLIMMFRIAILALAAYNQRLDPSTDDARFDKTSFYVRMLVMMTSSTISPLRIERQVCLEGIRIYMMLYVVRDRQGDHSANYPMIMKDSKAEIGILCLISAMVHVYVWKSERDVRRRAKHLATSSTSQEEDAAPPPTCKSSLVVDRRQHGKHE